MIERITKWFYELRRGSVRYREIVAAPITTSDATATPWSAIEIVPNTAGAGSITVRYMIQGRQDDGSQLYSATLESSWSWSAGGAITRRAAAAGNGTTSANTYASPRPSIVFDVANIRPTITGKAATTIVWSCEYRYLLH
jgi:hypothetical protein